VNFGVANMLIVKLWKCVQFRFDTRLGYGSMLDHQLQFRLEALVGLFNVRMQ